LIFSLSQKLNCTIKVAEQIQSAFDVKYKAVATQHLSTDSADFLITLTADSISSFVSKALTAILMLGSGKFTS
jgi:hypothetical protein